MSPMDAGEISHRGIQLDATRSVLLRYFLHKQYDDIHTLYYTHTHRVFERCIRWLEARITLSTRRATYQ